MDLTNPGRSPTITRFRASAHWTSFLLKRLLPSQPFSKDPVVEGSLRHSIKDGITYSVMTGAAENYFSAFALLLKASTTQIGVLASLPPLLASFAQLVLRMARPPYRPAQADHRVRRHRAGDDPRAADVAAAVVPGARNRTAADLRGGLLHRPQSRLASVEQSDGRHRARSAPRQVLRVAHATRECRELPRADRRGPDSAGVRQHAASPTGDSSRSSQSRASRG